MKHAVIQSFRTENVPPWISTCLGTVRHWTAAGCFGDVLAWINGCARRKPR